MWCAKLILISYFGIVNCRPQAEQSTDTKIVEPKPSVEIEHQLIQELTPINTDQGLGPKINPILHKKKESSTTEILAKIAEVNKNQGLAHKKAKPNYFHFPFSYSRSQEDRQKSTNFKFSKDPFTNPVLANVENRQETNTTKENIPSFRRSNLNIAEHPESYVLSMTDTNAEVKPEDHIPGQYIRRKVTHFQGFLMPNPYMLNLYNAAPTNLPVSSEQSLSNSAIMPPLYSPPQLPSNLYPFPTQQLGYSMYPIQTPGLIEDVLELEQNKNWTSLEKNTVQNIKDMISGTNQIYQQSSFPNFYHPNLPVWYQHFLGGNNQDQQKLNINLQNVPTSKAELNNNLEKEAATDSNMQNLLNNYAAVASRQTRQGWNWPGANLFPIYIRDPFLQMYYAITNMVEYGPNSGSEGPCKLTPRPQGSRIKANSKTSLNLRDKSQQMTLEINNRAETEDIKVLGFEDSDLTDNMRYLDIEDIDIDGGEMVKFFINVPRPSSSGGRELKDDTKSENESWDLIPSRKLDFLSNSRSTEPSLGNKPLTPIKDQVLHVEEIEDEPLEAERGEDISISNQGTKKVFSRENTGSGIFIHKLKVRQGGVAIAGPGGIATAGSGGTAIVGPNGVAYTHPDGLAIAGTGTKVVAVDPDIDLNDAIKDSILNGTRHVPNTRVGKVVAVGPVIYYNRG